VSDLAALQTRLGYEFRDEFLLRLALTHPSVAHEPVPHPAGGDEAARRPAHNQRLEFLGDAVLQLALTQKLYEQFPAFDEGALTKARAKLVNRAALAAHARTLGLGAHLILSRGEAASGGRERASAVADAFESLLGAVFLDAGFSAASQFVLREFAADISQLGEPAGIENPKGELQELLQSRSPVAPEYGLVCASGADHNRDFECAVVHDGVELARGRGKSKKAAESAAALAALKKLREENPK